MRMNYKTYPTDYVQELNKTRGLQGRKKSRAFMEYWNDMEHGDHNSYGFYAKSWDVSKSTAHTWIDEFMREIDVFLSHWDVRNKRHYNYAKNQAERLQNETNANKAQNIGVCENIQERQPNEDLNYYNNNTRGFLFDKEYIDFYFIYSRNTNYPGNKKEAYDAFVTTNVNVDLLKLAAMKYLNDPNVDKPVGVKKFLENEVYLPYMPKYMKVKSGNEWYEGTYNDKTYELKAPDGGVLGTIPPKMLVELFEKGEIMYLKELEK